MKYQLREIRKDECQSGMMKERVKEKAGPNQAALLGRFSHVENNTNTKRV